jgi:hypothetical protein
MYLKSPILDGLQLIGLCSSHVGFLYIAPPVPACEEIHQRSLSSQDYDFLCMTVAEALEFHRVSQRGSSQEM